MMPTTADDHAVPGLDRFKRSRWYCDDWKMSVDLGGRHLGKRRHNHLLRAAVLQILTALSRQDEVWRSQCERLPAAADGGLLPIRMQRRPNGES
jgi:hypothetical protein